jgi:acyl transferase domain-containing protein
VVPVVVSGLDIEGLRRQARRWAEWLAAHPEVSLAGVARTAALCRTQFRVRGVVVAAELADVVEGLWAVARGEAHPLVVHGVARPGAGVVFASSGHSGPWVVPQLLRESRVFARAVARYEALLRPLLGWSVTDVLAGDGELDLEHPEVVRVTGLVGRVATAAALRGVGVVPTGGREVVVPLAPVAGGLAGLMRVLAGVHVRGGPVLWERALPAGDLVDLPPYVFAPPVGAGSPG